MAAMSVGLFGAAAIWASDPMFADHVEVARHTSWTGGGGSGGCGVGGGGCGGG